MNQEVEISSLDLRYSDFRLKSKNTENTLLISIHQKGILEPLIGVDTNNNHILLDGFKRVRCAQSLKIHKVPYISIATEAAEGLLSLLRLSTNRTMSIIEQAKVIDFLICNHKMSSKDVAEYLAKSKGWVSMRKTLIESIPPEIQEKLFRDEFPVYSYMYTIRQFMRMNNATKEDAIEFVNLTSGKQLSVREIEKLANGYFKGSDKYRETLRTGNIPYLLNPKVHNQENDQCNKQEQTILNNLEMLSKNISYLLKTTSAIPLGNGAFCAQASLLSGGIVRLLENFTLRIKEIYDKTGKVSGDF